MTPTLFKKLCVDAAGKTHSLSMYAFLFRLIWLCVLPLVLLAIYLAIQHVLTVKRYGDDEAMDRVQNVPIAIDQPVRSQITALEMIAQSPMIDNPL